MSDDAPPTITSQPSDPAPVPAETKQAAPDLDRLRAELDRIDDMIHSLLIQRADIVKTGVARTGKSSPLRPGRQAAIIRRLLANHRGDLPAKTMVCLWLELMAGHTEIQGDFTIAVCETDAQFGFTQLAREHFGTLTRLRAHPSPAQALAEISAGTALIAILPLPSETDTPRQAWWTSLLQTDEPRIHVIARLPFWAKRPEGAPRVQALVVAASAPDPSGQDCSLVALECAADISRGRLGSLLEAAGLKPISVVLRRDPGAPAAQALVEVEGMLTDDDPRLKQMNPALRRPVVVGAYALGVGGGA